VNVCQEKTVYVC